MSFYPPIPISFSYSGDKATAARMLQEGRRRAGQLFDFLSGGYGNSHFNDTNERPLFSGKSGPFYYLTETGYFVTIKTRINGSLTYVDIDAVPRVEQPEDVECRCCRDCIAIGEIVEEIYIYPGSQTGVKYIVDLCFQAAGSPQGTVRLVDGAYPADGNRSFAVGEKYIVMANPALWNPSDNVSVGTNLRSWGGGLGQRENRSWQVFNCMELSDVATEDVDLLDVGIDNSLYTESDGICQKAGASIPVEDPEETDPVPVVPLRFVLTSIKVGNCLELA